MVFVLTKYVWNIWYIVGSAILCCIYSLNIKSDTGIEIDKRLGKHDKVVYMYYAYIYIYMRNTYIPLFLVGRVLCQFQFDKVQFLYMYAARTIWDVLVCLFLQKTEGWVARLRTTIYVGTDSWRIFLGRRWGGTILVASWHQDETTQDRYWVSYELKWFP